MTMRSLKLTSANSQSAIRIPKSLLLLVSLLLAPYYLVQAQPAKIPRIGFLIAASPSSVSPRVEAFRQGLRELGYVEGKNIVIEWRHAEGKIDRLPALAAELVRLKVDLIITGGPPATRSAKEATVTIPIVMTQDIETAFRAASKGRADAVLMLVGGTIAAAQRTQIVDLAVKNRLLVIYSRRAFVEAGGLMTYGVNLNDLDRRAATYVDKILKGRKPVDLPVEQPTTFEFIINLKAAKQIGLTIPPNVLARADKVIQ